MNPIKLILHWLTVGDVPLCKHPDIPPVTLTSIWPEGHKWTNVSSRVTCPACSEELKKNPRQVIPPLAQTITHAEVVPTPFPPAEDHIYKMHDISVDYPKLTPEDASCYDCFDDVLLEDEES